ncbi:MAG: SMI1/KNR4 family protein [Armatimonadetes bacterium]|nr:SMI1/KNR4 family protein [Armatimonadota bacterium]
MTNVGITTQCERIANKIADILPYRDALARQDRGGASPNIGLLFGASKHRLQFNTPLLLSEIEVLESRYSFAIPAEYRAFLLTVSGGGAGWSYGLKPPDGWMEHYDLSAPALKRAFAEPCLLRPDFAQRVRQKMGLEPDADVRCLDDWLTLIGVEENQEQWDNEEWDPFIGTLCLADNGCATYSVLILNGDFRGRVCHIFRDYGLPVFAQYAGFLDWYEAWIDGVLRVVRTL